MSETQEGAPGTGGENQSSHYDEGYSKGWENWNPEMTKQTQAGFNPESKPDEIGQLREQMNVVVQELRGEISSLKTEVKELRAEGNQLKKEKRQQQLAEKAKQDLVDVVQGWEQYKGRGSTGNRVSLDEWIRESRLLPRNQGLTNTRWGEFTQEQIQAERQKWLGNGQNNPGYFAEVFKKVYPTINSQAARDRLATLEKVLTKEDYQAVRESVFNAYKIKAAPANQESENASREEEEATSEDQSANPNTETEPESPPAGENSNPAVNKIPPVTPGETPPPSPAQPETPTTEQTPQPATEVPQEAQVTASPEPNQPLSAEPVTEPSPTTEEAPTPLTELQDIDNQLLDLTQRWEDAIKKRGSLSQWDTFTKESARLHELQTQAYKKAIDSGISPQEIEKAGLKYPIRQDVQTTERQPEEVAKGAPVTEQIPQIVSPQTPEVTIEPQAPTDSVRLEEAIENPADPLEAKINSISHAMMIGPEALAKEAGISFDDAKEVIEEYLRRPLASYDSNLPTDDWIKAGRKDDEQFRLNKAREILSRRSNIQAIAEQQPTTEVRPEETPFQITVLDQDQPRINTGPVKPEEAMVVRPKQTGINILEPGTEPIALGQGQATEPIFNSGPVKPEEVLAPKPENSQIEISKTGTDTLTPASKAIPLGQHAGVNTLRPGEGAIALGQGERTEPTETPLEAEIKSIADALGTNNAKVLAKTTGLTDENAQKILNEYQSVSYRQLGVGEPENTQNWANLVKAARNKFRLDKAKEILANKLKT